MDKEKDFQTLQKLIHSVDHKFNNNELSEEDIEKYQDILDKLANRYQNDESVGWKRFMLYELQALLSHAAGNNEKGIDFLEQAKIIKQGNSFISQSARNWEKEHIQQSTESHVPKKFNGKYEGWLALWMFILVLTPFVWIWSFFSLNSFQDQVSNAGVSNEFGAYFSASRIFLALAIILFLGLLFPYFTKKKQTRKLTIAVCAIIFIFGVIQYTLFESALQKIGSSIDEFGSTGGTFNALAIVWFFYWIFSKRVKDTFTL